MGASRTQTGAGGNTTTRKDKRLKNRPDQNRRKRQESFVKPEVSNEPAKRWRRAGPAERNEIVRAYIPLVKWVARKLLGTMRHDPVTGIDDLVGWGHLGLLQALERYEPETGGRFSTYAVPRIRGAILDGVRSIDWVPRPQRQRERREGLELPRHIAADPAKLVGLIDPNSKRAGVLELAVQKAEDLRTQELYTERWEAVRATMDYLPPKHRRLMLLIYDRGLSLRRSARTLGLTPKAAITMHRQAVEWLRNLLRWFVEGRVCMAMSGPEPTAEHTSRLPHAAERSVSLYSTDPSTEAARPTI